MNAIQSVQSIRGLAHLAEGVARKRPFSEIAGEVAGLAFAAKTGGIGSVGSGLVADAVEGAVAGITDGSVSALNAVSRVGGAAASYVAQGAKTLGRLLDVLV